MFTSAAQTQDYLKKIGQSPDHAIDIIQAGFALSLLDDAGRDIASYRDYTDDLKQKLTDCFDDMCARENSDNVHVQTKALTHIFSGDQGYLGDDLFYDDFKNINLFSVIDRRLGLPISLCMIAIGICRSQGWNAAGVNFPGHFIMRLEKDGERLMIDPFMGCRILEAKDLRKILKHISGSEAELSADYYKPCTNREILLRYQNNLKYRLIDKEDYTKALDIVTRMEMIAPDDYRLHLDRAVLLARLEQAKAAIEALHIYLSHVENPYDKAEAAAFLSDLQKQLN